MTQGNPSGVGVNLCRRAWLAWLAAGAPAAKAVQAAEPATAIRLVPLGAGQWWVPAHAGDADASNRGQVSHLVVVHDGARVWLVGSGPSPAFGAALARRIADVTGRAVTDVVNPWAHPELVLGNAAFPDARLWAHADVADAMRQRCEGCLQRLRARLGAAAGDLGDDPVRVPASRLHGEQGRLGPWAWRRLWRGDGSALTVMRLERARLATAHGLLWPGGAPDLRDADLDAIEASTRTFARWLGAARGPWRIVGEQGPLGSDSDVRAHVAYWAALRRTVAAAIARGEAETLVQPLEGIAAAVQQHPHHALNWQRAWRQLEATGFGTPAPRTR